MRLKIGIFAYESEDGLIDELPDFDATAEPNDLPDFAVQPGVVDPAGLDDTAGRANISDDDGVLHDVGYMLKAEAATIPGHTHAVCCDKSCSGFECDVGYMLKAESATIPGHTHAVCCDKYCSGFECDVGYIQATPAAPASMSFAAASSAVWASC